MPTADSQQDEHAAQFGHTAASGTGNTLSEIVKSVVEINIPRHSGDRSGNLAVSDHILDPALVRVSRATDYGPLTAVPAELHFSTSTQNETPNCLLEICSSSWMATLLNSLSG